MGYASTESVAVVANIAGRGVRGPPDLDRTRCRRPSRSNCATENGAVVRDGELGEVHVRSPYVMLGYWNDPKASAAVLKGGRLARHGRSRLA